MIPGLGRPWRPGRVGGGVGWMVIDSSWYVRAANIELLGIANLKESDLVDQPLSRVQHLFQAALGPHREQLRSDQRERYIEDVTLFENKAGERSLVRAITLPSLDETGNDRRLTLYLACRRPVTPEECAEWSDGPAPR